MTASAAAAGGDKPAFAAAECPPERLEWQTELDSAMADIDHRLEHPRRRATDLGTQPSLPQLGQIDLTSELLDEIAWRVSEQVRRALAGSETVPPAKGSPETHPQAPGIALTIRVRKPLFGKRKINNK
jgi:hypothetical protein